MAGKSEQITAHDIPNADWDTPFRNIPTSDVGEFSRLGANAQLADTTDSARLTNTGVTSDVPE